MKVDNYEYLPHKHLYIKHYIKIVHSFSVVKSQASPLFLNEAENKEHLSAFSEEAVYSLLNYFERQLKLLDNKKSAKKKTTHKSSKHTTIPVFKYGKRWPKPAPLKKRKMSSLTTLRKKEQKNSQNPNKDVDKRTWAVFNARYPGQQPAKGQIVEIRKEILAQENKQ